MAYTPTNAALEVVKQIATSLASVGAAYENLLNAFNGSPPPGFNIAGAEAPIDGWLRPAAEAQATVFQGSGDIVPVNTAFTAIGGSAFTFTPYCPRNSLLVAQMSGFSSGVGLFAYRVKLDATVIATASFYLNTANVHATFPALQAVIPAAAILYPLVPQTLTFEVATPVAGNFNLDTSDVVSYSVS